MQTWLPSTDCHIGLSALSLDHMSRVCDCRCGLADAMMQQVLCNWLCFVVDSGIFLLAFLHSLSDPTTTCTVRVGLQQTFHHACLRLMYRTAVRPDQVGHVYDASVLSEMCGSTSKNNSGTSQNGHLGGTVANLCGKEFRLYSEIGLRKGRKQQNISTPLLVGH